ncbi:hypothetical protein PIB30_068407 [Stylosanthes scabra]|uniref:Transmembrane protein n=1 Tax=Stylosanthes scabra TaxID=79078 RepID=A0ABU6ZLK1_9FABA|nr:hypothetical protein [Stylosanthes scabra]
MNMNMWTISVRSSGTFWCHYHLHSRRIHCSDSNPSPGRGFGLGDKTNKGEAGNGKGKGLVSKQSRGSTSRPPSTQAPAPRLSSQLDGKSFDLDFEERLQAVRRSALEQKKADDQKQFGPIDYDAPPPPSSNQKTIGLATKVKITSFLPRINLPLYAYITIVTQIGVGVAVAVFGLVFAFGDFLPSGSVTPDEDSATVSSKLSEKEKATLQSRLKEFEATLRNSPRDATALE